MFATTLGDYAHNWPWAMAQLLLASLMLVGFYYLLNALTRGLDDNRELFQRNNLAFAVLRVGQLLGFMIGAYGSLQAHSLADEGWSGAGWILLEGLWVGAALIIGGAASGLIITPGRPSRQLILEGNHAVALAHAAFYVGFGFILDGSLIGSAPSSWLSFASTAVFGLLGLAVVLGVFWLHELVTPYHIRQGLHDGRMTTAIEVAGVLIAVPVVVSVGVAGDFTGWGEAFAAFFATVIVGVVTLYVARYLTDLVILTGCTVKSVQEAGQVAPALILSGVLVGVSFLTASAIATYL